MSTKRYVARELLEQHTKQKKQEKLEQRRLALEQQAKEKRQAKIHIALLIIVFVLPLFLFPAYPRNHWQYEIYRFFILLYHGDESFSFREYLLSGW